MTLKFVQIERMILIKILTFKSIMDHGWTYCTTLRHHRVIQVDLKIAEINFKILDN